MASRQAFFRTILLFPRRASATVAAATETARQNEKKIKGILRLTGRSLPQPSTLASLALFRAAIRFQFSTIVFPVSSNTDNMWNRVLGSYEFGDLR